MEEGEIIEGNKKEGKNKLISWLKKLGWIGFLFFLIKGLIWLAIFYFVGKEAVGS